MSNTWLSLLNQALFYLHQYKTKHKQAKEVVSDGTLEVVVNQGSPMSKKNSNV